MNIHMNIQSSILVITIAFGFLSDIEAMHARAQRSTPGGIATRSAVRRLASRDALPRRILAGQGRHIAPRVHTQKAFDHARDLRLARQLSPERTFARTGHFGQFRTPQRLRAQRHYLNRIFRGHNWQWWWRHRPYIFYRYFPFYFYNTYGYYPPIYYDYFDVYGIHPTAYSYTAPAGLSVEL